MKNRESCLVIREIQEPRSHIKKSFVPKAQRGSPGRANENLTAPWFQADLPV
jgi:hypothetical protein